MMTSIMVAALGLVLLAIASTPTVLTFIGKIKRRKRFAADDNIPYEDNDGTATEESQKKFSTIIPRSLSVTGSIVGCLLSLGEAVLRTSNHGRYLLIESWLVFASWVGRILSFNKRSFVDSYIQAVLVIQALNMFFVHDPLYRYRLGIYGALSSIALIAVICIENGLLRSQVSAYIDHIVLASAQLACAFLTLVSFSTIRRRPDLFRDGKPVDAQHTFSILERYSFTWAGPTLKFARQNRGLDLEELPQIAKYSTSNELQQTYNGSEKRNRLWKTLGYQFRWQFLQQNVLTLIVGVSQFVPQFAMYNLLKILQARSKGEPVSGEAWLWVFGLGLSMIVSSLIDSWINWIVWADLGIAVRSLLSILVFIKATRRKDVKGVSNAKRKTALDAIGNPKPALNGTAGIKDKATAPRKDTKAQDDEDEDQQKSRQSTINLVGVDAKRVSDFCSSLHLFPGIAVQVVVSMWFLSNLIGWRPLVAGLLTFSLSFPVNIYVSKKYNSTQGDLMKLRDQKMAVVTEALQGIRQIKFSALERQWQAKISVKRTQELRTQWRIFKLDSAIISLWIFCPVMLSAVSLAVYAHIYGELTPAIAFTTIAVFGQIEGTLATLPGLMTDALDSWVSIGRIENYLNAPEKVDCTTPSDSISFEKASIAWPSDSQEQDSDRFILRDINIQFPKKELSVISGKTGSGKSLLLAAILGEVDKMTGIIRVPKVQPLHERYEPKATKDNWIIESAIAYVAQIPWIENATIKDNILFGLPHDADRYNKVLEVCALEKDLDMLEDGEMTDIGANGINLSGGQRWRVSFARALYSRAGILVLDDIFSAVDTHVGRQLFEDALLGKLGAGRTRILATHHVALCLPGTKYTVVLSEGTVACAGLVADLKQIGSLEAILDVEQAADREDQLAEADVEVELEAKEFDGGKLSKILSCRSGRSNIIDNGEVDTKAKSQPKKFTEDEKRETGSIKLDVYTDYFSKSGGFKVWVPLIMIYVGFMGLILGRVSAAPYYTIFIALSQYA